MAHNGYSVLKWSPVCSNALFGNLYVGFAFVGMATVLLARFLAVCSLRWQTFVRLAMKPVSLDDRVSDLVTANSVTLPVCFGDTLNAHISRIQRNTIVNTLLCIASGVSIAGIISDLLRV